MAAGRRPRSVTYSREYDEQARVIEPDYRRLDEMVRGAEWALARTELRGSVVVVLNPGGGQEYVELYADVMDNGAVVTGISVADY